MALQAFLSFEGGVPVKGSAQQKGREGKIVVSGVRHEVVSVLDDRGLPKGSPKHSPFVVIKNFDSGSTALHAAQVAGTVFSKAILEFWRMPPRGGIDENYMTIVLQGARISAYRTFMDDMRRQENQLIPEYEEVSFAYEKIHWKYKADKEAPGDSTNLAVEFRTPEHLDEKIERAIGEKITEAAKAVADSITGGIKDAVKDETKDAVTPDALKK
jgi:type VI secretion system secreted protein Hcp